MGRRREGRLEVRRQAAAQVAGPQQRVPGVVVERPGVEDGPQCHGDGHGGRRRCEDPLHSPVVCRVVLAVAEAVQGTIALTAALAAALVLILDDARRRAPAMVAALVLAGLALAAVTEDQVRNALDGRMAIAGAAVLVGGVALVLGAWLFRRKPWLVLVFAFACMPIRIPLSIGGETANLLLPLYAVIASGVLARAARFRVQPPEPRGRNVRRVELVLAAVLVLYAVQSLYSEDVENAVKNICFFYVPFALLFRLLLDLRVDTDGDQAVDDVPRRARAALRRRRHPAVLHEGAAAGQREGADGQRAQAVLPGQQPLLRPQHLRALPRADDGAGRRADVVDAAQARDLRLLRAARAAVGRPRAVPVGVELRGAGPRPRRARRPALAHAAGTAGARGTGARGHRGGDRLPGRGRLEGPQLRRARPCFGGPRGARPRRSRDVRRQADLRPRFRLLRERSTASASSCSPRGRRPSRTRSRSRSAPSRA